MSSRILRRRAAAIVLSGLVAVHSSSCGTLLHPERVGQPRVGRIDPAVAVLDGVGLLLFVVPGAIAFAIDFYTGAIYLPPGYADAGAAPAGPVQHTTVHVNPDELTPERIEQVIAEQTGRRIELQPGHYRAARMNALSEWQATADALSTDESAESPVVDFR